MILVEFFEKDAIENICSSLVSAPEKVIFIGPNKKLMAAHAAKYEGVLSDRGVNTEFSVKAVGKNNLQSIIDVLSALVEENTECVFDLTGGDELYLTALGVVYERYKSTGKIKLHRFSVASNTIIDCDQDGSTISSGRAPQLSVEENIRIYGGDIVYNKSGRAKTTARYEMTDSLRSDINGIWSVCRTGSRFWNAFTAVIGEAAHLGAKGELSASINAEAFDKICRKNGIGYDLIRKLFNELSANGLILLFTSDDTSVSFTFKNELIKQCLTVAGKALEMKVFAAASDAYEDDGSKTYNDVMTGVVIDWDGELHPEPGNTNEYDTENEIDVMMMHGMVPVFVSCKNGGTDADELYKLQSVAARFGGKYAKKVLIATSLDDSDKSNYIRQRAEDMEIRLIEGHRQNGSFKKFTEMNDRDMNRVIRSLWIN